MINISILFWFTYVIAVDGGMLPPEEISELKNIVTAVEKDVEAYLGAPSARKLESDAYPSLTKRQSVVVDIRKFNNMLKESFYFHFSKLKSDPDLFLDTRKTDNSAESGSDRSWLQSSKRPEKNLKPSRPFGSVKGVPGVHYPNYTAIPTTGFTCTDKEHLPAFYADMETGCQVFHACWPDRRETFLCPKGTIFNQALLVCDYWYNSNCTKSADFYFLNSDSQSAQEGAFKIDNLRSMLNADIAKSNSGSKDDNLEKVDTFISRFMPIKATIVTYPRTVLRTQRSENADSSGHSTEHNSKQPKSSLEKIQSHKKQLELLREFIALADELIATTLNNFAKVESSYFAMVQHVVINLKSTVASGVNNPISTVVSLSELKETMNSSFFELNEVLMKMSHRNLT